MNIKEIIVVEGKSDTIAVRRATGAETIETNGSAVSEKTLLQIEHAQETRGVIIFTDPDYPGRRIRAIIEERVPGVKHAFLHKKKSIAKNGKKIGIEHAADADIREALEQVYTPDTECNTEIPLSFLYEERLIGHPDAKQRRDQLAALLNIGQVNGKGLKKRLEMFRIEVEQVKRALEAVEEGQG
ncbi:ribonuclease M5 [Sporosarcina luteola]|nr:ribonuclease M5 [Sporosarcina luteola]